MLMFNNFFLKIFRRYLIISTICLNRSPHIATTVVIKKHLISFHDMLCLCLVCTIFLINTVIIFRPSLESSPLITHIITSFHYWHISYEIHNFKILGMFIFNHCRLFYSQISSFYSHRIFNDFLP